MPLKCSWFMSIIERVVGCVGPIHERVSWSTSSSWIETCSDQNPLSKGTRAVVTKVLVGLTAPTKRIPPLIQTKRLSDRPTCGPTYDKMGRHNLCLR